MERTHCRRPGIAGDAAAAARSVRWSHRWTQCRCDIGRRRWRGRWAGSCVAAASRVCPCRRAPQQQRRCLLRATHSQQPAKRVPQSSAWLLALRNAGWGSSGWPRRLCGCCSGGGSVWLRLCRGRTRSRRGCGRQRWRCSCGWYSQPLQRRHGRELEPRCPRCSGARSCRRRLGLWRYWWAAGTCAVAGRTRFRRPWAAHSVYWRPASLCDGPSAVTGAEPDIPRAELSVCTCTSRWWQWRWWRTGPGRQPWVDACSVPVHCSVWTGWLRSCWNCSRCAAVAAARAWRIGKRICAAHSIIRSSGSSCICGHAWRSACCPFPRPQPAGSGTRKRSH